MNKIFGGKKTIIYLGPNRTQPYVIYDCSWKARTKKVTKPLKKVRVQLPDGE